MIKLEYIWLGGNQPQELRSKTRVVSDFTDKAPEWGFDGSSTEQAAGDNSDLVLNPVRTYPNPLEEDSYLVMCEVLEVDGTPHTTNHRSKLESQMKNNDEKPWFGFEQEYTLFNGDVPLGWEVGEPAPQGDYYCGRNIGEELARKHMDMCINTELGITGINAEVMLGQWEYQIFGKDPLQVSDDLWIARWLLEKLAADRGLTVSLHPKPIEGDWNGAGMHTNFSTDNMRDDGGDSAIHKAIEKLRNKHLEHIAYYGEDNEQRLTGKHETCDINTFRWGVSDRGASIRVPWQVNRDGKGYFEDTRPSSNADPYVVAWKMLETICGEDK